MTEKLKAFFQQSSNTPICMKQKNLKLCVSVLFTLFLFGLNAQKSVVSSGGKASGTGGTVSYSAGQVSYQSISGTGGSVTQGVQQVYIQSVSTGSIPKGIDLKLTASPNPVSDVLLLKVSDSAKSAFSYLLYDMNGKILQNQHVTSDETSISMGVYSSGSYLLKVIQHQSGKTREIQSFKIIKK